jgi:hypothetical protein
MATATIEPGEQSRMMIPFSLAAYYYDFSEIPPPIEIAPLWSCPSVSLFGLRGKEGFEWRSCANVSYWPFTSVSQFGPCPRLVEPDVTPGTA